MTTQPDHPRFIFSLRWKIILPFMFLALFIGLGATVFVNQLSGQENELRLVRQLRDSGQQATDEVVRIEERLLEIERAIADTEGVPDAVAFGDSEELRQRILSLVINLKIDVAVVLDREGTSLLASRRGSSEMPDILRGEAYYQDWPFVRRVLMLNPSLGLSEDPIGEKQSGLHSIRRNDVDEFVFFIAGPLIGEGGTILGAVLVGEYLENLVDKLSWDARADISIYDVFSGQYLSTTFESETTWDPPGLALTAELIDAARSPDGGQEPYRSISVAGQSYGEVLTPFTARQGSVELGVLGISLLGGEDPDLAYRAYREQVTIVIGIGALVLILIIFVGILISNSITRPLVDLAVASSQVAIGNLDTYVSEEGRDEVGVLARTFNRMVEGLREGAMYRDLFGGAITAQLREQMRESLSNKEALLRGHSTKATILFAELQGLTSADYDYDPMELMRTLNSYFAGVAPIITQLRGVLNKFDGETIMASFGILPRCIPPQVSALLATHAGLEILNFVKTLNNRRRSRGVPLLGIRVGISTGNVIAGRLGTKDRLHYTVVGDTVATAQNIQRIIRDPTGGSLLIGEDTYHYLECVRSQFEFGRQGRAQLHAVDREITVYEVQDHTTRLVGRSQSIPEQGGS